MNFVVLESEVDYLGSDGPALCFTPSQLSALGETAFLDRYLELQNDWMPIAPALIRFLIPVPFLLIKALDFQMHEVLLKRLGLWDSIHLDYGYEIRRDLLEQLVLNFDPRVGFSSVDRVSIEFSRMATAGALKLPLRQVEIDVPSDLDFIEFIEDFLMNGILLHEDVWMMEEDVYECIGLITRKFGGVDWAS